MTNLHIFSLELLAKDLEEKNTKVIDLTEEASKLQESVEDKIKEINENKNEINSLNLSIKDIKKEYDNKLDNLNAEMCTLQEEKSVVDEKLLEAETNLKQITLDHSKKVENLQLELKEAEESLKTSKEQSETLTNSLLAEVTNKNNVITELKSSIEKEKTDHMAECKTLKEEHFGEIECIKKDNEVLLNECESEKQEVVLQLERAATNLQNSHKDNSKLKDDLLSLKRV